MEFPIQKYRLIFEGSGNPLVLGQGGEDFRKGRSIRFFSFLKGGKGMIDFFYSWELPEFFHIGKIFH